MIGFLLSGALAGLGALAWPLYLHLFRHRKPHVVAVPSLLLFSLERRRNRRRRLSDLLLLLARLLILTALCLLLARPYLRTQWALPLPSLAQDPRVLGVVVDTSLRALGRDGEGERFERQRAWLLARLETLPPEVAVAVVTTTQPMAAPVLSAADAVRLLADMRPVPVAGNASEAVRVLQEQTTGIPSLICVAASRDGDLWPDDEHEARILLHDTTEIAPPRGILHAVRHPMDTQGFDCELFGFPADAPELPSLVLETADGEQVTRPVTAQEMLQRRLRIAVSDLPDGVISSVGVAGADGPWDHWYLVGGGEDVDRDGCLLVVDGSAPSLVAKALVVAAVQAVRPDLRLRVATAAALAGDAPQRPPRQLALLALASPPGPIAELARRVLGTGGRVFVVSPPTGGDLVGLLSWEERPDRAERTLVPTDVAEDWFPVGSLELSGLAGLRVPRVRTPVAGETAVVLVQSDDGPVIVGCERDGGRLVALGVPPDLASDSPVFHPVYPHLLASLISEAETRSAAGGWRVGNRPSADELFSLSNPVGRVVSPAGGQQRVAKPSARVFLDTPGIWRLEREGGGAAVAVNHPRPSTSPPLPRDQWAARYPHLNVIWATADMDLAAPSLYVRSGRRERAYDASPVAALLLLVGLAAEALLRVLGSKRGGEDHA